MTCHEKTSLLFEARQALVDQAKDCERKAAETRSEKYQTMLLKRASRLHDQAAQIEQWKRQLESKA